MIKEEKQPVDVTEQPIVFMACISFFLFFCICFLILFYQEQLSLYLFFLSICEDK